MLLSARGKIWRRQHLLPFRTAAAKANLPKSFVFHGLRHTYASELIRAGASLDTVAKQFGHANTMTVMKTYGHFAERAREAQVAACFTPLDEAFSSQAEERTKKFADMRERLRSSRVVPPSFPDEATTLPRTSVARPNLHVVEAFNIPRGRH